MLSAEISTIRYSTTAMSYAFWHRLAALGLATVQRTKRKVLESPQKKCHFLPFVCLSSHANTPSLTYTRQSNCCSPMRPYNQTRCSWFPQLAISSWSLVRAPLHPRFGVSVSRLASVSSLLTCSRSRGDEWQNQGFHVWSILHLLLFFLRYFHSSVSASIYHSLFPFPSECWEWLSPPH